MTRLSILLLGAGGHARSCIDVIERESRFRVAGLIGLEHEVGSSILGYPVLGSDEDVPALRGPVGNALVTVGQIQTADQRIRLFDLLNRSGYTLPVIVSPSAYVSPHATVGAGTIVMHGAVVNAGAVVGSNCILNSQSLVEHDALIGSHCHIATGATINGGARVGAGSFVGSGSSVRECVTIGERCVIGMGQAVIADCAPATRLPPPTRAT